MRGRGAQRPFGGRGMPAAIVTAEMAGQDLFEWARSLSEESYRLVLADMTAEHRVISLGALQRAITTSSRSLVEVLQGKQAPFALTNDQLTVVRDTARRQFPLRDIVRGLRIVHRHWTEVLLDLAEDRLPPAERAGCVRRLVEVLTRFFDDTVDAVMVEYLSERQRLIGCTLSARRETVVRLLAGGAADDADEVLGLPLGQHHVAIALAGCGDQLERLQGRAGSSLPLLDELAAAVQVFTHLVVPGDDHEAWAWLSAPRPFGDEQLEVLTACLAGNGAQTAVGVGRPRQGRDGFCQSLADARDALHIAALQPPGRRVVTFQRVRLAALLAGDVERARRFVHDELGELAGPQPATAELRATLRAYYECEQSLVRTAARLYLHRNTVVYRLRRIEQLLGRPVGADALELHAALDLAANLGLDGRG